MKEFLKEWKKKYPKCYKEFEKYLAKEWYCISEDFKIKHSLYTHFSKINLIDFGFMDIVGHVEKFFEKNNIFIYYKPVNKVNLDGMESDIKVWKAFVNDIAIWSEDGKHITFTKENAQKLSYLKVAEVLEKELNN